MTRKQLEALIADRRPDLALDVINGSKGWYKREAGQAASFRGGYASWKQIALDLELIDEE